MGWKEFLKPDGEKLFLFAILFVFSVLVVSFNIPVFTGEGTQVDMLRLREEGYYFGPPSFATVLVVTFAIAPTIIVITYLMACMIAHPKKAVKPKTIKKKKIKKRK